MKDNEEKSMQSALEASAQANGVINQDENIKTTKHMVDVVNKQHDPKPDVDENHSMCGNCEVYKHQIANIMTLINEIKAKQEEESQRAVFKSTNLEITIKTLSEQNNKMAGEIEQLNLSVSELSGDNANIKCVLDIKQNEWTKRPRNHQNLLSTKKKFHSHLMHFKYLIWKNQVLAITKIPKKPTTQGDHLRTQLVVESVQNLKARN